MRVFVLVRVLRSSVGWELTEDNSFFYTEWGIGQE